MCFQAAFYIIPLTSSWIVWSQFSWSPWCVFWYLSSSIPHKVFGLTISQSLQPSLLLSITSTAISSLFMNSSSSCVWHCLAHPVPTSRSSPWHPAEIVCVACAVPFCSLQVSQKHKSHVKKSKQGVQSRYFLELFKEIVVRSTLHFLSPSVLSVAQSHCDVTLADLSSDPDPQTLTQPCCLTSTNILHILAAASQRLSSFACLSEEPVSLAAL